MSAGKHSTSETFAGEYAVFLNKRGEARVLSGHPWVFKSDVARVTKGTPDPGIVTVRARNRRFLGRAMFSTASNLAVRILTRKDEDVGSRWFEDNMAAALKQRLGWFSDTGAFRWLHGESDRLPGLYADVYGDCVSVQVLSSAMEAILPDLLHWMVEVSNRHAGWPEPIRRIVLRNDGAARSHEGLKREVKAFEVKQDKGLSELDLAATRVDVTYSEWNDLEYSLDLIKGQKTGAYLDQQENHRHCREYARGAGRALDAFSYHGGFAMNMARAGASHVIALESGEDACFRLSGNLERNGLADRVEVVKANVFDMLRELDASSDSRFDMVVLDPPSLAKSKSVLDSAARGYKELNLRAMRLLSPGGILVTCSCSPHVSRKMFGEILSAAASDTRRTVQVLDIKGAGRDHPVLLSMPETEYLQCWFLAVR